MYLPHEIPLRVCYEHLHRSKSQKKLHNTRVILLQHLLPDTEQLVQLLVDAGVEIFCILGKPFSLDGVVEANLRKSHRVEVHPYSKYDETEYLDSLLFEAYALSRQDNKKILILEVGGYFAKPLTRVSSMIKDRLAGVVEVTTFGHNKYSNLVSQIDVPVFSVARSRVKRIEARYVGDAVAKATENILGESGVSFPGRQALVLGYGMIGECVADAIHASRLQVSVYDKSYLSTLSAYTKGYKVGEKDELIKNASIIFSATAEQSMSFNDILKCRDNTVLASAGSRGNEFDVQGLKENCVAQIHISKDITKYKLSSCKSIFLLRNGTAVNFHVKSCPDEIVDLIHAEVIACGIRLLQDDGFIPLKIINESDADLLNGISKDWIKHLVV